MSATGAHASILSLAELSITTSDEVRHDLTTGLTPSRVDDQDVSRNDTNAGVGPQPAAAVAARERLDQILAALKTPPALSILRVNEIVVTDREQAIKYMQLEIDRWILQRTEQQKHQISALVFAHPVLGDVVCVELRSKCGKTDEETAKESNGRTTSLYECRIPPLIAAEGRGTNDADNDERDAVIFKDWPRRQAVGWPMTHKVVICDRFCGEAVLRGADIFVRGVQCADAGIVAGDTVAVYAHLQDSQEMQRSQTNTAPSNGSSSPQHQQQQTQRLLRGMSLENYSGPCVFLGLGVASCKRSSMFVQQTGVAVQMSCLPWERAGPVHPPLSSPLLSSTGQQMLFAQNLPSILVGHVLQPAAGDIILDMCSAPGGKASHVASLVKNLATIVAVDKSHKKMVAAKELFDRLGASCIHAVAADATKLCSGKDCLQPRRSVQEILETAETCNDGRVKKVRHFPAESFDRILLDPPCSALGLRPKLQISQTRSRDLQSACQYQKKFIRQAVQLLKEGGIMTYSTCTIHNRENEGMVRYMLDEYPDELELVPIAGFVGMGRPGLSTRCAVLTERECQSVRRFDPCDDTMGFFIAKFRKRVGIVEK